MKIKGIKLDGWPRLATLGYSITKEEYRSLQGGGTEDIDDVLAARLIAIGVAEVVEEGAE